MSTGCHWNRHRTSYYVSSGSDSVVAPDAALPHELRNYATCSRLGVLTVRRSDVGVAVAVRGRGFWAPAIVDMPKHLLPFLQFARFDLYTLVYDLVLLSEIFCGAASSDAKKKWKSP
jgi:hypothetical protein